MASSAFEAECDWPLVDTAGQWSGVQSGVQFTLRTESG